MSWVVPPSEGQGGQVGVERKGGLSGRDPCGCLYSGGEGTEHGLVVFVDWAPVMVGVRWVCGDVVFVYRAEASGNVAEAFCDAVGEEGDVILGGGREWGSGGSGITTGRLGRAFGFFGAQAAAA